jgi:hypothetical protein
MPPTGRTRPASQQILKAARNDWDSGVPASWLWRAATRFTLKKGAYINVPNFFLLN